MREALGSQICLQYADNDGKLRVINLSQGWAEKLLNSAQYPEDGSNPYPALDPVDQRKWVNAVSNTVKNVNAMGYLPVVVCPKVVRMLVHSSVEREMPGLVVISIEEISSAKNHISVEVLGEIAYEE